MGMESLPELWPSLPHLSMVVKAPPAVSWDPRNIAFHEVMHEDILLPAVKGRNSSVSLVASAHKVALKSENLVNLPGPE